MTGPVHRQIVQIHPTRHCNLRCRHCYSESGPDQWEEVPVSTLCGSLRDAREEGFDTASFSGGEPLLYSPLRYLLREARALGYSTNLVTNGMLLTERRIAELVGYVDVLAISLDGRPETHDRMRRSCDAFAQMKRRLPALRESTIPFGFIFTLTQWNMDQLPWVARFAVEQGAVLLQVHPLEAFGAGRDLQPSVPDGRECLAAFLAVASLQAELGSAITLQIDLCDRGTVEDEPGRVYADEPPADPWNRDLSELASPLVIQSDGWVVPFQYGMPEPLRIGNVNEESLATMARRWKREGVGRLRDVCRRTADAALDDVGRPFFNWYEAVRKTALR
ncbi:MAG: radical SAM protein [Myxococcota bacterium]